MAYCQRSNLKQVLHIRLTDTTKDAKLDRCLVDAGALVDGLLNAQRLTVPKVVPQIIVDATKYFAAWDFQRRTDHAAAEVFWQKADKLLSAYTEQYCHSSVSFNHPRKHKKAKL